jgi:hypothetical protein
VQQQTSSSQASRPSTQDASAKSIQCDAETTGEINAAIAKDDAALEAQVNTGIQEFQDRINTYTDQKSALVTLSVAPNGSQPFDPNISSSVQIANRQNMQNSFTPMIAAYQSAIDTNKASIATIQNLLQQEEGSIKIQDEGQYSEIYQQCMSQ